MIKKITKHGNSQAIVLDKPILELLNITENTELKISTDGQSITISPLKGEGRKKLFSAAMKESKKRHGAAYKKLASM